MSKLRVCAGAVVCLGAVVGCTSENQLVYTATLEAQTKGVALSNDGLDAYAGMVEQTCTIDTNWGCPTADADITSSSDERVVDHWGNETLAVSSVGLHRIVDGRWDAATDVVAPEVRAAALFSGGKSIVYGQDGSCWMALDGADPVLVADEACDDGVKYTVNRATGTLFAGTMAGVYAFDADGYRSIAAAGNLVSYDASLGYLYVATLGARSLRALDERGAVVWEVTTGGPVVSIAARGEVGEVLVLTSRPDGLGEIERRDGSSGRLISTSVVADGEGTELVVSESGTTVATVDEDEGVDFYDLLDGTTPPIHPTPPECITPTINGGDVQIGD